MTSTTRELAAPALRLPSPEPLAIRITGGGLDGRVIRLASPKCTVGSGPRCTLRLLGPGIRPLHCLIVRSPRGDYVRQCSPETRLNGRSFRDGRLHPGDRLTIGPLDLEVLAGSGGPPSGQRSISQGGGNALPTASAICGAEAGLLPPVAAERVEGMRGQIGNLRKRARGLVEALRAYRRRQEELENRIRESLVAQEEAQQRISRIAEEATQATQETKALRARLEVLERERTRLAQQNENSERELRKLQEMTHRETETGEGDDPRDVEEPTSADKALQDHIHELSAELNAHKERERALIKQLKLATERLADAQRHAHETASSNAEHDAQVEARIDELEREKSELAELRRVLQQEQNQLAAERAAWESERQSTEPAQGFEADSTLSSLGSEEQAEAAIAHLREMSLWSDGGSHAEDDGSPPTQISGRASSAPVSFLEKYAPQLLHCKSEESLEPLHAGEAESTENEEDESLAEYMAKLMQRVRGDETPQAPPRKPAPQRAPAGKIPPERAPIPQPVAPLPPPTPFRLQDIKRTAALPERSGNFAAMRELANQSAHTAISSYQVRRVLRVGVTRLVAGLICLACGTATLYLAPELLSAATAGGAAGLLLAAYFFIRGILSLLAALRRGDPVAETGAIPPPPSTGTIEDEAGTETAAEIEEAKVAS